METPEGFLFGPSFRSSNIFSRFCNWKIKVPKGRKITLDVLNGLPENYKIHHFDLSIAVSAILNHGTYLQIDNIFFSVLQ